MFGTQETMCSILANKPHLRDLSASPIPFFENAVQIVQNLPPSHTLVLNKFNTVRNHALLITEEFQPQEEALTRAGKRYSRYLLSSVLRSWCADICSGLFPHFW